MQLYDIINQQNAAVKFQVSIPSDKRIDTFIMSKAVLPECHSLCHNSDRMLLQLTRLEALMQHAKLHNVSVETLTPLPDYDDGNNSKAMGIGASTSYDNVCMMLQLTRLEALMQHAKLHDLPVEDLTAQIDSDDENGGRVVGVKAACQRLKTIQQLHVTTSRSPEPGHASPK